MNLDILWVLLAVIASFIVALLIAPVMIHLLTKKKAEQTVLGYVKQHEHKTGTPTMGGWIFVIPAILFCFIFFSPLTFVAAMAMLAYAVLGFLDDFIKVRYKRNLGLKVYQKIIGQVGAAVIIAVFCYKSEFIGTSIRLPFTQKIWDLSWGIIPFVIFIYLAMTNGVNLTDGLDGLAGWTSVAYFGTFTLLLWGYYCDAKASSDFSLANEMFSLATFSSAMFGGLLGYLWFNSNPSSIMMGDTGSLALGAAAATVAVFSRQPFLILFAGIMYVISCVSVILQVLVYKATKKRIIKMAPFHHHLELSGYKESKITIWYFIISIIGGIISIIAARVV
ncbi:MAG: phospho-N-acetylmuramoyl-pentapeptide-transferase [Clostridiales bacterium]|nr:phospho-N-acetylmuramoyl-pentapeptide-transferase [Clostridiales bacterium]